MYKVMIVDDEPFVRQGLISLINWAEYDFQICCESDNGIDALKSAKEYSPDLIITDIRMPEMSGLELIRECEKELKSGCKYIILSGYSEFEYARQAMSYGVVNYILKPIDEDEVKESLAKIKKELDEKNQRLSSFLDYKILAANVLKKYMNGQADKNKLNKVREFIPNFDKGKFCYGIILPIEIENKELKEYSVAQMVKKFISQVFAQSTFIYVIEEENTQGILFTDELYKKYKDIEELGYTIINKIKDELDIECTLYLGEKAEGIVNLVQSRETCLKAINNNFILAQKGVLSYEKLKDVEFNYDSVNKELLENLLEAVEKNNVDKIYSDIEKIEIEIVKESTAPEVAKSNIISFEFEVLNNIINMKGDPSIISNSIERLQNDFTFVKDLKNRLQEFCIETAKYISDLKQYKSKGVLLEVKDYIENNFQKDLRLKSLSEHFYINPIYLGQIFKKNFGMSFNDYLNNIRVEKAKELLLNTDKKICDIAENVGYKDTNYFISRFEKITHTTPTEYKKICKKDI